MISSWMVVGGQRRSLEGGFFRIDGRLRRGGLGKLGLQGGLTLRRWPVEGSWARPPERIP